MTTSNIPPTSLSSNALKDTGDIPTKIIFSKYQLRFQQGNGQGLLILVRQKVVVQRNVFLMCFYNQGGSCSQIISVFTVMPFSHLPTCNIFYLINSPMILQPPPYTMGNLQWPIKLPISMSEMWKETRLSGKYPMCQREMYKVCTDSSQGQGQIQITRAKGGSILLPRSVTSLAKEVE